LEKAPSGASFVDILEEVVAFADAAINAAAGSEEWELAHD
jgi:hypothetical protein